MPIYAYRCDACGHTKDVLQKLSDAPLTTCPACGKDAFAKALTAPAFQLKGSGWYVTDFRDNGKKAGADAPAAAEVPGVPTAAVPAAGDAKPAAAPAAAPAASPAPAPASGSGSGASPGSTSGPAPTPSSGS